MGRYDVNRPRSDRWQLLDDKAISSKKYEDYRNQIEDHNTMGGEIYHIGDWAEGYQHLGSELGWEDENISDVWLEYQDWSASDKLINAPTDTINAILKTIIKFEMGPRSERHLNPGAIIYSKNVRNAVHDIYGINFTKGDSFKGGDGKTYYTADFSESELPWDDALTTTRYIVNNLLKKSGGDLDRFISSYTGQKKGSEVVEGYVRDIKSNLKEDSELTTGKIEDGIIDIFKERDNILEY